MATSRQQQRFTATDMAAGVAAGAVATLAAGAVWRYVQARKKPTCGGVACGAFDWVQGDISGVRTAGVGCGLPAELRNLAWRDSPQCDICG